MNSQNHSKNTGGAGVIILDDFLAISDQANEFRKKISRTAWNRLSAVEQAALKEAATMVTGNDEDLQALYTEAVLIVNHMHHQAQPHSDPAKLLAAEHYRFWY
ncbi:MAG TPA: hypothetical protein VLF40_04790 [Candidatus Saccharimonadales bacterium]|nr:hypothetical protein [Candidatus Saccharimonadales bacterium]